MLLAMAGAAVAGPYEDALAAWKRGDYATEYRLSRPLVDQCEIPAGQNYVLVVPHFRDEQTAATGAI